MTTEQELKQWALNDYKEIRSISTQECALDRMIERLIEKTVEETRKQVLEDELRFIENMIALRHKKTTLLDYSIDNKLLTGLQFRKQKIKEELK